MLSGLMKRFGDNRRSLQPTIAMYQRWYARPSFVICNVQRDVQAATTTVPSSNGPTTLRDFARKHKLTPDQKRAATNEQSKPKTPKNAKPEPTKAEPVVQAVDERLESLRSRLRIAQLSQRPYDVEAVMREVRSHFVAFNAVELSAGFEGCLAVGNIEMSTWVLSYMKSLRYMIPAEYIGRVVKRASSSDQLAPLVALVKDLTVAGNQNSKQNIEEYLNQLLLELTAASAGSKGGNFSHVIRSTYDIYLNLRNEKKMNIKLSRETYTALAMFHVRNRRGDSCLEIFQEMNRVNVEPDLESCEKVLDEAIAKVETKVVKLIVTWYLEVFNVPMDIAKAQEILKMAVKVPDGQLAILAFQLLTKTSITPDRMDYYNLVRALLRSNDIVSAVEALQDMEARNVSFIPSYKETFSNWPTAGSALLSSNAFELHEKVKNELRDIFAKTSSVRVDQPAEGSNAGDSTSNKSAGEPLSAEELANDNKRRYELLQDFYYALIDQVQKGQPVPRIVVDVILEAMGTFEVSNGIQRAQHMARLRSIFDEYPTVFKLEHDITSYIALIRASSCHANFSEMLTLFQQLEQFLRDDTKPSPKDKAAYNQYDFFIKEGLSTAYSELFHYMVDRKSHRSFGDIWQHMRNEAKVLPTVGCLLRLCTHLSVGGAPEDREAVLTATNEVFRDIVRAKKGNHEKYPYIPPARMAHFDALRVLRSTPKTSTPPLQTPVKVDDVTKTANAEPEPIAADNKKTSPSRYQKRQAQEASPSSK